MKLINKKSALVVVVIILIAICGIFYTNNTYKQKIFKSNYNRIRVVIDNNYPPYIFRDSNGTLQGISVDQWKLWQSKTGIEVELDAVDWNNALSSMAQGKYDVIDTMFINDERKQKYDFSSSYAEIEVPIFYNKNISGIIDAESLKGFKVGVKKGDNCIDFLKQKGIKDLVEYDSYESIIKDAKDKKIMVFVMDKPPALYFLFKYDISNNFNYSDPLYKGQFHRAVVKDNSELLSTIELGFSLISKSDYRSIDNKWFGSGNSNFKYSSYFLYGSIALILIITILLIINWFLKRKINQKTYQLSISEKKYMDLFFNLNVAVVIYSKDRQILLCNNLFREFFKIEKKEELSGNCLKKLCKFIINPDGSSLDYEKSNVNIVFETKMPVRDFTMGIRMEDGEDIVWVKGDCIPELDENGEIDSIIITLVNITERINTQKRIYEINSHDGLTELFNRNYFEEKILMLKKQKACNVGIIICDLDGLKLVNDTLGHAEGDNLIKSAAYILKKCCKDGDIIARIGGDEFVIIVPDTTESELDMYKNCIINTASELNILQSLVPVSISVGYSISKENDNLDMVFKQADDYMYREKLHRHQSKRSKNIDMLSKMLAARDFITEGHGDRMQYLSTKLAKAVGMSNSDIKDIILFAQFHDIGKIGIPDAILYKPGRLDDSEMANMKRHIEIGYRIAESSHDLLHISDWILKHHERWDGQGYPYGLKGEEIPVQCRILAIVDAYDAMTNDRPYRKAMQKEKAIEEIKRCMGTQFDPELAKKFIELF